ncbi:hypothetical protein D3C87_1738750 [compost metagenome]
MYSVASAERSPSSSVRTFCSVDAAMRFSMSSSSGFSSSMRFCTVSRLDIVPLRRSITWIRLCSEVL